MTDPLEFIEHISRLELRPGDVLVVRSERDLDSRIAGELHDRVMETIGERMKQMDVKVMILTSGLELSIIRKDDNGGGPRREARKGPKP
jgi:hypothetical protein